MEGTPNTWTFTMPTASVKVAVMYDQPYTVTVAPGRFATFFADKNIQLDKETAEDVTLHTITGINGTEATVSASLEGAIAAETPLLVYNGTDEEQTVTILPTIEQPAGTVTWANEFRGTALMVAKTSPFGLKNRIQEDKNTRWRN